LVLSIHIDLNVHYPNGTNFHTVRSFKSNFTFAGKNGRARDYRENNSIDVEAILDSDQ